MRDSYDLDLIFNSVILRILPGGGTVANITNAVRNPILQRLDHLSQHELYKIWGYTIKVDYTGALLPVAQKVIPGQTISLNDSNYFVKEISYETETLDTIKSFNATCIKL